MSEESINVKMVPVEDLQQWKNNARIHTNRNIDVLKNSLTEFKQMKPIVVQKSSMRIIAGNGTYQAALALGWKEIACNIVDIDDDKAEAYAILDNRSGLLSQWDDKVLTESLQKMKIDGSLSLTGFDDLELDKMISFQTGDAFEKITSSPKDKPKEKEEKKQDAKKQEPVQQPLPDPDDGEEKPAAYDDQISFTMCGFVFALSNMEDIQEIHALFQILKDAPKNEREEVNQKVFDSIKSILTEKFMR